MNLMIAKSASRSKSAATHSEAAVISYATGKCALGQLLVARSAEGVCAILLGSDAKELGSDLASRFPRATLVASEVVVRDDLAKVIRFVEKPTNGLDLTLDMRGTPLQRRIWEKIQTISVGRTVSYSELARWISPLLSPRVVAAACAANPNALVIPCHRVVSANGDLAGYRWGIERKRELLKKEALA
jgi:O-6-methylguanine DNA methyltransferase